MLRWNRESAFTDNSTTVSWIELIFEIAQQVCGTQLPVDFQRNPSKASGVEAFCCFAARRGYRKECGTKQRAKFRHILHTLCFRSLSKIVVRPLLFRTSIDRPILPYSFRGANGGIAASPCRNVHSRDCACLL